MESIIFLSKYLLLIMVIVFGNCYTNFGSHAHLIPEDEVQTLKIIFSKLKNDYYWNVNGTICSSAYQALNRSFTFTTFRGVECDCSYNSGTSCHVTSIKLRGLKFKGVLPAEIGYLPYLQLMYLDDNQLGGALPDSLGNLSSLQIMNLSSNNFFGSLPETFSNLKNLTELYLDNNKLGGALPNSLGTLNNLQIMYLDNNQLGGALPDSLGNLSNLQIMSLYSNNFYGSLPETFSNLNNLTELYLHNNQLAGALSDSLGNLSNLQIMYLHNNQLGGALPDSLGNLSSLQIMNLSSNNFFGSLPETFGNLNSLTELYLANNQLGGALPDSLGNMSNLQTMYLDNNQLGGALPDSLGNLSKLQIMSLSSNNFFGSIPETFSNLEKLIELYLDNNQLGGALPDSLGNLSSTLQIMSLSSNNFFGSIPETFSNLENLIELYLDNNQLGGALPDSLGNLSNLQIMYLDNNQLAGSLPDSLGNLSSLLIMDLSSNNFSESIPRTFSNLKNLIVLNLDNNQLGGALPDSLGNLSNLQIIAINGNRLSGKIPAFIGNWINIKIMNIQGTDMEGPIPSTISSLTNLIELRISDLNGASMAFPNLQDLKQLEVLVLRNCLVTGAIPEYIGNMTKMLSLDLSFNRLTGEIPYTIGNLQSLKYMFLTNNSLNGSVPNWLANSQQDFDVSYNSFTRLTTASCQQSNVNLVSSFSLTTSNINSWCLMKDLPCPKKPEYHSLFINCGGEAMNYDGNDYDEDLNPLGPSYFAFSDLTKWAYSSTGVFSQSDNANFIASNTYKLNVMGIYKTARLSPLSLRYYGLCLQKGSYRVQLHFAEIMYSNDQSSIRKRIFDVYIQENLVLKDFNIMEKAGGVGKGITMNFSDILVDSSTLEISLYWAGKGTAYVLERGANGPLISAITITPTFPIADFSTHTRFSIGAVVGIVIASCVILASLLLFLWMKGYMGRKSKGDEAFQGLDTSYFSLRQIKAATDDFSPINKIGEDGFGPVYKGILADGKMIAIKQLSSKSRQGNREFVNEIGLISALHHPNLVKLYGCCIEGKELLLIYEYMENNSLARALFGRELSRLNLDWPTRKRICLGIARGLAYLHEESRLKIVHRDIKATNILLDKDLNAKISDFGLAKLDEDENTHISTRIAGTVGYMAPEYAMRGYLTDKADVYSFGVVVLEIISGKSNTNYKPKGEFVYLLDWAYVLQEQGNLLELVDPSLGSNFPKDEILKLLNLALLCANPSPTLRPIMSSVVSMIEGQIQVQAPIINQIGMQEDNIQFRAFKMLSQKSKSIGSTTSEHSQVQKSISADVSLMNLSMSSHSKNEEVQDGSPSSKLLSEIELFDVNLY